MEIQTGHIGLNVSNIERSKRFYQDALGFEVLGESEKPERRFAFLGQNKKLILTLWQQSQGSFENQRPGLHHLSFQADSIEKVREAEHRLRTLGVRFHYDGIVPHGEGLDSGGIFFEDPDGIRLEIFASSGVTEQKTPVADAPSCGFF